MEKNKSSKKVNKRKLYSILSWTIGPVAIAASIGGAIYFVVKNSQKVRKEYWSPADFKKTAAEIEIKKSNIIPVSSEVLLSSFGQLKEQSESAIKAYEEAHPELNNPKTPKKIINKLLKDRPKEFDVNSYLSTRLITNRNFDEIKFLNFKYTNIEPTDKLNEVKVSFEITLNYEYARGDFELNDIKGTKKSKYYYESSQVITILTNEEKWNQGTQFYLNEPKLLKEVASIIKKSNDPKWTKSQEFIDECFTWFKNSIAQENAYPDIFPGNLFDIIPYKDGDNPAVIWNPAKSLNTLSFTYQYVDKETGKVHSEGRKKIFTISNI
ncbi:hypothetical protein [Metamycoplasma neophronis]|uniref:Uncharacterized protein n=1 Tax=Metamycoplasma neophronis TaxID=872983 RepID=A0ABY2Z113_9BACT|nr:hypothetical protein [Metamycoplasma neophronis]TPR54106.1 hypothetical protein FJR74_01550 [Metamycoplasma neophronis]